MSMTEKLSWLELPASIAQILISTDDLEIVACNQEACRLYRCTANEMLGSSILKWSPSLTEGVLHTALQSPHNASGSRMHRRLDGTVFTASVAFSVLQHEGKNLVCKFVLDASGAAENERRLHESQARFRAVADYTYDWESWIDEFGKIIWVNPAVERLTGYSVEECYQQTDYPLAMVHETDQPMFRDLLDGAQSGSSGNDIEFRVVKKSGGLHWFAVSWQSLRTPQGNPNGFRMSMRDIDDRKAIEEKLLQQKVDLEILATTRAEEIVKLQYKKLQTEKLASLGIMSASIAHEINNPLAGIRNALRLVRDREQVSPESQRLLRLVDGEIVRISELLAQMHKLCSPTISVKSEFDLVTLLDELFAFSSVHALEKGIRLNKVQWPETLPVSQHEAEIKQILYNLVRNAIEASSPSQSIDLHVQTFEKNWIEIKVRDYGKGIEPNLLSSIFEPFVTTKQSSGKSGLGLGLFISQNLAISIGGSLVVSSTVNEGAIFTLKLPSLTVDDCIKPNEFVRRNEK